MQKLKGFTLIEIMIALLLATIFLAAATPIITRKHATPSEKTLHGQYECYYDDNGILSERMFSNGNAAATYTGPALGPGGTCRFVPPKKASYFVIQAVGGGGGGGMAGTEFVTSRETTVASGTFSPITTAQKPSWLTADEYSTHTGNVTVTYYGGTGGKGGKYTYTAIASPTCTGTCIGSTVVNYGQMGEYGAICQISTKMVVGLDSTYSYTVADDGDDGDDGSTTIGAATAGNNGSNCVLKLAGITKIGQGGKGGLPGTSTTNYEGTRASGLSNASAPTVNTGMEPSILSYSEDAQTKFLTFGEGGSAGVFSTIFIPSLDNDILITIGRGGRTGLELLNAGVSSTGEGEKGGKTTFGNILSAEGGAGGIGLKQTAPFQLTNQGTVAKQGTDGKVSAFTGFTQLVGLGSTGMSTTAFLHGSGGKGGGSWTTCTVPVDHKIFTSDKGTWEKTNTAPSCSDALGVGSFADMKNTSVTPNVDYSPLRGADGAIVISW